MNAYAVPIRLDDPAGLQSPRDHLVEAAAEVDEGEACRSMFSFAKPLPPPGHDDPCRLVDRKARRSSLSSA
jgi:hypothetical protein